VREREIKREEKKKRLFVELRYIATRFAVVKHDVLNNIFTHLFSQHLRYLPTMLRYVVISRK
jgi:hypothetical protein